MTLEEKQRIQARTRAQERTRAQFSFHSKAYLESSVHSAGKSLERLIELIQPESHWQVLENKSNLISLDHDIKIHINVAPKAGASDPN